MIPRENKATVRPRHFWIKLTGYDSSKNSGSLGLYFLVQGCRRFSLWSPDLRFGREPVGFPDEREIPIHRDGFEFRLERVGQLVEIGGRHTPGKHSKRDEQGRISVPIGFGVRQNGFAVLCAADAANRRYRKIAVQNFHPIPIFQLMNRPGVRYSSR